MAQRSQRVEGRGKATMLDFNYDHPPKPVAPNALIHLEKIAFNKAYWYLVPTGVV